MSGWRIEQSLPMELDVALGLAARPSLPAGTPDSLAPLAAVPDGWRDDWPQFLGRPRAFPGLLILLAELAGTESATDYRDATLPMRQLTVESALRRVRELRTAVGLGDSDSAASTVEDDGASVKDTGADDDRPPAPKAGDADDRLTHELSRFARALVRAHGLDPSAATGVAARAGEEFRHVADLLVGGERHAAFWMWLDHYYHVVYAPWRAEQADQLAAEIARAAEALGGEQGSGAPDLEWLTPQNALRIVPAIRQRVEAGDLNVVFWAQPFGLFDLLHLRPNAVVISFSPPGALLRLFEARADDLSQRLKALSDSTRLKILRLIRNLDVDNTDIAEYLELARPTVSVHAKQLRDAGLIETRREGRSAVHSLKADAVRKLEQDLHQFLDLPPEESGH